MKIYLKPNTNVFTVELNALLTNSVNSVTGDVDDINVSNDEFAGGNADSRRRGRGNVRNQWEDDEMDEEQW